MKSVKTNSRPRARLADIADACRVSRTVVGQVLNGGAGNSRVSPKTAERIRRTAARFGYRPNPAALQLRGKRSSTFGVLVASAGDPLRSFLVQHLDVEAAKVGCHTIIGNTIGREEPNHFADYVDEFSRRGVDGVFCAVHDWFAGDRQALLAHHPNTVFYERQVDEPGTCVVKVDRAAAVRLAVRHLVERGRKRIALAVTSLAKATGQARLRGYRAELAHQSLPFDERLVFSGEHYGQVSAEHDEDELRWKYREDVVEQSAELLVAKSRADAIIAHDDFWAATLIRSLRARGVAVPEDVAIVGYLNHYLADWTDPPLTTIDLQHGLAARQMVQMMESLVTNGSLPKAKRTATITPRLIVRAST